MSSLLGIGAGIIVVPVLSFAWDKVYDDPQKLAQGTALALMVPMAIAGAMRYHFDADPTNWKMSIPIALWALIGSVIVFAIPLIVGRHLGLTGDAILGNVSWHAAAAMVLGAIIGSVWLGAPLANVLPTAMLRLLFGILTIIIGIKMIGLHTMIWELVTKTAAN